MIDDVAAKFGATVYRTPVGEAHVAGAIKKHGCVFGGEGNGGVIWPHIGYVRDSLAGIALTLEMLATTGQTLSQLVSAIPAYAIVKDKLPIQPGMAQRTLESLKVAFADRKIDLQDGIRIDSPEGWVHVRASNTEPILRIIAEARDTQTAQQLIKGVREAASL
jgi:phosphomannomutase